VPFQWATTQDQHLAVRGFLSSALDDPAWETIKAVHPSTGQILAWGSGKIFPSDWDSASVKKEAKKETEKTGVDEGEKGGNKDGGWVETEFSKFLGKEEQRLRKLWFSGRRWFYLCALFTDPEWEAQGIGSAVIEKLCERADEEGVVGFLQGTRGATGFYESRGWRCIERFEVDLGKWVGGEGWGYGVYTVGYLVRLLKEKEDVVKG
jgi:GNAT superfamily N-acetyltransferase